MIRQGIGISAARRAAFGAAAVCALLWVAVWNRYPTVFSDTGSYLYTGAFFVALWPFRSPGYSVFTRAASLGISGWGIVIAQAIVVVYVLHEACAHAMGGDQNAAGKSMETRGGYSAGYLLGIVCALAALTSLPWEVSLLMPDVFASVAFLAMFLLAFGDGLGLGRRVALALILAIAVSAHASLLPIAGVFAAVLAIARNAGGHRLRRPALMAAVPAVLAWLLVPILAAALGTATLNREMGKGFKLSPAGNDFLLARLASDGLAGDFLRANCPQRAFMMCQDLVNLPMPQGWFLFYHPLLRAMEKHGDEIGEIVRGTLMAYPVRFAGSSIAETARQMVAFQTGDEIRTSNALEWNASAMRKVFPSEVGAFTNARQARGTLLPLADALARVHTVVFWLSLVGCFWMAWRGRARRVNEFFYATLAFLAINAAVCATLAGVYDRYQTRVAWLVPLCLLLYLSGALEDRHRASL